MTPEEQVHQASRAKAILEDDLVKKAFSELESAVCEQWKELAVSNKEQAEELKRLLWAAQQFKSIFTVLISSGAVAQNELLMRDNMQIKQEAALRRIYG